MAAGWKPACIGLALTCLIFPQPPVARSQGLDEGEFSPAMLRYKLQLLSVEFEQAKAKILTRGAAGVTLKKLDRIHQEIECLEAALQRGRYYPDLLDEQIVTAGEKLRLTITDPVQTTPMPPPPCRPKVVPSAHGGAPCRCR